jgi:iron complex transport system ATP-binding protein
VPSEASSPTEPSEGEQTEPVLALTGVGRTIDGNQILRDVDWIVRPGEHWAVLGPNGSGKTTVARIASLRLHPTVGQVRVLGTELGRADIRPLLGRVGYAAAALADELRPELPVADVVMTAKNGALEPWWHTYDAADRAQAAQSLERVGVERLAKQHFGSCSSGEKQRVLIARALMTEPALLILDEPTAALDLAGREAFVATLDRLAADPNAAPMILITHHVDEIPTSFTHALLMANGAPVIAGEIDDILTAANLKKSFGMDLNIERRHGRWWAWADR